MERNVKWNIILFQHQTPKWFQYSFMTTFDKLETGMDVFIWITTNPKNVNPNVIYETAISFNAMKQIS